MVNNILLDGSLQKMGLTKIFLHKIYFTWFEQLTLPVLQREAVHHWKRW